MYQKIKGGRYDFVFAGAGFLSVGAAATLAERGYSCLVFDRLMLPGHEFSSAIKTGRDDLSAEKLTPLAGRLYSELTERGAVSERGGYFAPALTPLLSLLMAEKKLTYYPLTVAGDLEITDSGFAIKLYSQGCLTAIEAGVIVDTTKDFELAPLAGLKAKKSKRTLNAVMHPPAGYSGDGFEFDGHKIVRGGLDGEYIALFDFPGELGEVRVALSDYILSRPAALEGWRIASLAEEFDVHSDEIPGFVLPGLFRAPDVAYTDPVLACSAGERLADTLSGYKGSAAPALAKATVSDDGEYDLIVAGLGTAGAIAAVCASREGLRVFGLEQLGCMGGAGTAGVVLKHYIGFVGGAYTQIDRDAAAMRESGCFTTENGEGCTTKALALERAAASSGVKSHFGATIIDVIKDKDDDKRVTGLVWCDANGIHRARAKYVIDATAEGSVCIMAGCEMQGGRSSDGNFHVFSHATKIYNRETGNVAGSYQDVGNVNQYDPAELGKTILHSSTTPLHLPERFDDELRINLGTATWLGIREGYRIVGEECVRLSDLLKMNLTREPLFYDYANIDNHGKDASLEDRAYRDWIDVCALWDCYVSLPVPAGALIPAGYRGLLVAGRCLSVDHSAAALIRMKDAMQKSGEAAALMVTEALKAGVDVRELPYEVLRAKLTASGALGESDRLRADYYNPQGMAFPRGDIYELMNRPDRIREMLKTTNGGAAIMAAAMKIDQYEPMLRELISTSDSAEDPDLLRLNCAFALCLGDRYDGIESIIVGAISDKSGRQPQSSHSYNYPYAIAAMSAAARADFVSAIPELISIVRDPHYADDIEIEDNSTGKTKLFNEHEDIRYHYFAAPLAALADFAERHPEIKPQVAEALAKRPSDSIERSVSMMGHKAGGIRRDMTGPIEALMAKFR